MVLVLAKIRLDAAAANAKDRGFLSQLSDGKYAGTKEGDALVQCTQLYGNAAGHLGDAREPLSRGEYDAASRLVSGAEDDTGDAREKAFADRGVGDVDQRMKEQCGVAGDLIDLLNV